VPKWHRNGTEEKPAIEKVPKIKGNLEVKDKK
jgi:hypothetical protein